MAPAALFAAAIILALAAIIYKRVRKKHAARAWEKLPGHHPTTAVEVETFDAIDEVSRKERCHCGGFLEPRAEASRNVDGETLRVVRTECSRCEDNFDLFFRVRQLLH